MGNEESGIKVPKWDEEYVSEDSDSDYEGLQDPPVRRQLQNILRQYPDGPQIIRELVQNAEDAKASTFKVMTCMEDNLGDGDFDPKYKKIFQGPALCAFNDGVFNEKDWKGIKTIYVSVKEKDDTFKIGRFGLGFKSVFHLTDTPVIISGDRLLIIDPTSTTERVCHNVTFKKLTSRYRNTLWPVLRKVLNLDNEGVFGFRTSNVKEKHFPNTLFWFPLRRAPSTLLEKIYLPSSMMALIESFRREADTTLLFLRYISSITIMENRDSVLYKVTIEGTGASKDKFSDLREYTRDWLKDTNAKPEDSQSIAYNALVITKNGKEGSAKKEVFKIVNFYQGTKKMSQGLKELSEDGDNAPFVGVAYPLQMEESFNAHVFCFLPLPFQSSSLTNLPVHVNGFFNLDQARDHVLQATAGQVGKRDKNIEWNERLIKEVISQAYIKLIEDLLKEGSPREIVYCCLPDAQKVDSALWKLLLQPVMESVLRMNIFQTEKQEKTWVSYEQAVFDVFVDREREVAEKTKDVVIELIKEYGENLVILPKHLRILVESHTEYRFLPEIQPRVISTEYVANLLLKDHRYKEKNRSTKVVLLGYFLEYGRQEVWKQLELLPTNDKTHFVSLVSTGTLYLCSEGEANLFPELEKQLLSDMRNEMKTRLMTIQTKFLKKWSPNDFPQLLEASVEAQGILSSTLLDNTNRQNLTTWIKRVWSFLSENQDLIPEVETLPILPESKNGKSVIHSLYSLKGDYMLARFQGLPPLPVEVKEVLEICGVSLLEAVSFLPDEILTKYIAYPRAEDVCKVLEKAFKNRESYIGKINQLPVNTRKCFAAFLGKSNPQKLTNSIKSFLQRLKLFPVSNSHKAGADLYSVDKVQGIAPGSLENFPVKYPTLLIDGRFLGLSLADSLGCRKFEEQRLMEETLCAISSHKIYKPEEVALFMNYFMERLNDSTSGTQLQIASSIPFLKTGDNELKAPEDLFYPTDREMCELFQGEEKSRFPKKSVDCWKLQKLKMKTSADITAADLLETVTFMETTEAKLDCAKRKRKANAVLKFIGNLQHYFEFNKFIEEVKQKCWMPVMRKRPDRYPKQMDWKGEEKKVCKPIDACSQENSSVVGSVCFISDCDQTQEVLQCLLQTPNTDLAIQQLKHLAEKYKDLKQPLEYEWMLKELFDFLAPKLKAIDPAELKQLDIVPTKLSFTKSQNVYIEFLSDTFQIQLEPYMYQLSECWTDKAEMRNFFIHIGCKECLTTEDLILVQEKIRDHHNCIDSPRERTEIERDLHILVAILEILNKNYDELSKEQLSHILFPVQTKTEQLVLKPAQECTYTDDKHIEFPDLEGNGKEDANEELHFVHEMVRESVAECLGVSSLTRRVMESGGIEDLEFEQWGQVEPLTTRIRNLLEEYADGLSVFKEMLQNADDAGASCMKILYDERQNVQARTGLIDKGMEECQGPALWFYNDAKFEDKDFQNIIKLGGGTKKLENTKIGKFGLGFCSVYNITDVPSIISGKYIVFFDPRTIHLGKAIKDKSKPGLRIPISKVVSKFKKQFMPYNKIFNCDLSAERNQEEYDGTLFRLPLRTATQAKDETNSISSEEYRCGDVVCIIKKFMESAGNLLLFTQNVEKIKLYSLQADDPERCCLLYLVERSGELQCTNLLEKAKDLETEGEKRYVETFNIGINVQVNSSGVEKFFGRDYENTMTGSVSNWMVSWAVSDIEQELKGSLPVASTAIPLSFSLDRNQSNAPYGFYNTGHVFCFLPLPQESQTLAHLNGCFAVEQSRKRIVSPSKDVTQREKRADWNQSLMSTALSTAYINMLENIQSSNVPAEYSAVWPVSFEGNPFNPLVSAFYKDVSQSECKVFYQDGNPFEKVSLGECVFLDFTLQDDPDVGKTAFQCLKQFNPFGRQVMHMPLDIQNEFKEAGCESYLDKQICSEENFFTSVFLVNLQDKFWNSDKRKEVRSCLLRRILRSGNGKVLEKMKEIKCIPTKPEGLLRKPSDLIDPTSDLHELFCVSDNRFPKDEFMLSDVVKQALVDLGMNTNHLPDGMLLERVHSIHVCAQNDSDLARKRCIAILKYITRINPSQSVLEKIKGIPFLPVMKEPSDWPCQWGSSQDCKFAAPDKLFRMNCKYLIGNVQKILDENIIQESGYDLFRNLSMKSSEDVEQDLVICQLKTVSELGNNVPSSTENNLRRICEAVYEYLNNCVSLEDLKSFQTLPCILTQSCELVEPRRTSLGITDDVSPYIYKIDSKWSDYENFLLSVGVHQFVESDFIVNILESIEMVEGKAVENLNAVVKLFNLLDGSRLVKEFLLPDRKGIMRKPKDLCFEDGNDKINDRNLIFTHADLRITVCKKFSVQSRSAKYIRKFSSGMPFGQKEKLVTRLHNILEDYPCDISILNELLQNADDAGATEIHFVYDKRNHPEEGLFDESMKSIQGPALVVFNDSSFSEKDIEGISRLGEGSKSDDPNKTGQFGIGFNAVYHITDAPSFLSKGEKTPNGGTLIMFDPHCRYVPDATPESPGLRVDDLSCVKENYSGTYKTYLQDILPASSGTWFRFPLRTEEAADKSEITKEEVNDERMSNILGAFEKEMSKSLLFLNNVRCIKLSEIEDEQISTRCEVSAAFVHEKDSSDMRLFQSKCMEELLSLKKGQKILGEQCGFSCNYCIDIKGKAEGRKWNETWAVSRVFGTMTKNSLTDELRFGYKTKTVNLSPRAGIAACLTQESISDSIEMETSVVEVSCECDSDSAEVATNSPENLETLRAFCFLPLQCSTGLPVHINGHFALNSSRTNIWRDDGKYQHTVKGSWNELILSEILPFAYITSLQFLKEILFPGLQGIHADNIDVYNSFFPVIDRIKDDIWKTVAKMLYHKVVLYDIALFPVLLDDETITSMRDTDFILARETITDQGKSAIAFVPLKNQEQRFPAYFNQLEEQLTIETKELADGNRYESEDSHLEKIQMLKKRSAEITKIFKMLGLKLLNSTYEILQSIKMSIASCEDTGFIPKAIEAPDVLQYLLSWNSDYKDKCRIDSVDVNIQSSVLKDVTNVQTLLSYCFQNGKHISHLEGIPLCVLDSGILTCFSGLSPKIVSEFCHLLKDSKNAFLNIALVPVFEKSLENSPCIQRLTIARFAELLKDNINGYYKSEDPVSWNLGDLEEPWIKEVWTFLASTNNSKKEVAKDCIHYLSEWCLVPTQNRTGEYYLYPFCLADAVLSTNFEWKDGTMSQVMPSIDFPRLLKLESFKCKGLANYICASESTPHNVLRLFQYHRRRYCACISTTLASQVLMFLLAKLHSEVKEKDGKILALFRDICLFETLDGMVTNLPLERKTICLKDEDDFPQDNLPMMCQYLGITLLRRKDFLEDFGIDYLKQEDFYVDILLPKANYLDNPIIRTHMEHIKNTKMYSGERSEMMRELILDIKWIENEETGALQRVCNFYSPYLEVCYLLCSQTDLLPAEFHDSEWEDFMEFAGIKKDVPFEMLLDFGSQIENSTSFDELVKRKSRVLLNYIFQEKKLKYEFSAFMRKFRKINCVLPFEVPETHAEILPQCGNDRFVCFEGSVFSKGWELIWSQCIVVPEKIVGKVDKDILGIRKVPNVNDVINHIHKLCAKLKTDKCTENSLKLKLMECVYTELDRLLSYSPSRNFLIQELKRGLTETPFIYNHCTDEFLCPYEVALHLDTKKCIGGYLHSGPERFGKFYEMFRQIGVENHPGFYHYLRLFNSLHRKTSSKTMAPDEIKVAEKALKDLLKCLEAENLDSRQIPQLVDLYLPSEDNKLVLSTELILCDRPSFKTRLAGESTVQYVKIDSMQKTDLLKNLPDQFRPKSLFGLFHEVTDIGNECEADEHISRLRRIFQSEAFVEGIITYIQTKLEAGVNQQQKSSITRALQNVRFKQVTSLQTVLKNNENQMLIDKTRINKQIYYTKTDGGIVIYLKMNPLWTSFQQCFKAWKSKLSQVVCLCVPKRMLISYQDGDFIAELLICDSDIDIVEVCKKHQIQLQMKSWSPALGSHVPIDLHDTLDNTFCDFQEGDIVAYEVFDPLIDVDSEDNILVLDSEFIYVRVIEKDDDAVFPHYTVFNGTKEISVSSIKLYKFVRKAEEQTTDLVPFSTDRIKKQSTGHARILADIKRMLIAAWKLPRTERRAIIKRLLLQWHPDKNPGNTDLAKEVTQFILDIIGKLERGEIEIEDYTAGYSGGGSSYHYRTSQNEWHRFQENVNSCGSRRHQNRRHGGYFSGGYYSRSTYMPKPPDPQPAVGLQWLRQSKYDCRAAIDVLRTGEQQDSSTVKIWNWVCYMSHQSCEKALKAVLYGQDANIATSYRTTHDLSSLSWASPCLASARDAVNKFASDITNFHTIMRYPSDGQLPGDRFTKKQAEKAVGIAQRVIEACENCLV
ncbi:sacsin-like [Saccostrea echinata]|uniref:sacsin-like n=1 Tax=Saccostrea echinata TaxID=191078 RepID=UPI002A82F5F8|nr:sacsin-like [Saccostrea echinata]